jgi:hypothetical protein
MSRSEWFVAIGGVLLIAWINWYFFLAGKAGNAAAPPPKDSPKDAP